MQQQILWGSHAYPFLPGFCGSLHDNGRHSYPGRRASKTIARQAIPVFRAGSPARSRYASGRKVTLATRPRQASAANWPFGPRLQRPPPMGEARISEKVEEARGEVPVQACFELVDVTLVLQAERSADWDNRRKDGAVDGHSPLAEVQIVVFGLDRPVIPYRPFEACSHGPTESVLRTCAREEGNPAGDIRDPVVGVGDVGPRDPRLSINQPAVMGDADGIRGGSDPVGIRANRPGQQSRSAEGTESGRARPVDPAPGDIRFSADHQLAELVAHAASDAAD